MKERAVHREHQNAIPIFLKPQVALGCGARTSDRGTMPVTPGAGEARKARYEALSTTDAGSVDSPDESKPATRVVSHPLIAKGKHGNSLYKL